MLLISSAVTPMGDVASRQLGWNMGGTPGVVIMYGLALVAFLIFAVGLRKRIKEWKLGKPVEEGFSDWCRRTKILIGEIFLQKSTCRRFLPGLFHSLIFYSFIILFITTLIVMGQMDFGINIFHGNFYLIVSLLADLAGALLLVGVIIAAVRRYLIKPDFLPEAKPSDMIILWLLAILALTGFLAEGARIRFHPDGDPWQAWTPIGSLTASLLGGLSSDAGLLIHSVVWWVHALCTFAMIALVPFTKFFHMLAIPTNQLLSKIGARGSLRRIDIEELFADDDVDEDVALGVAEGGHLTWKQRLDLSACIECGRCDEACPARAVDQPLSPRSLICDIRDMIEDGHNGPIIEKTGTVFEDTDFIWHCRSCFACQDICPAAIPHVDLFIELRRSEVMMEARLPSEAAAAMKVMETQGNPFGSQAERMDLVTKLGIPVLGEGEETDILFWIGCCATFDPEKHRVAEDMIAILKQAGLSFAHLGRDEVCCGDPARLMGEENIFQMTAKQTVETLNSRTFKKLLVICPHCYNVFNNEYPQFDGHYSVVHHTELIAQLIKEKKITLTEPTKETVVYHDPCYLGRYQSIFDAPRKALDAVPGIDRREMERNREDSFCCGAGGGHYWMDLDQGDQRLYTARVDEAKEAGASTIAVGCIYCYQMLVDGLKARDLDEKIKIDDVANIVRRSMKS